MSSLSLKKAWKPIPLINNINFFLMQNFSWDLVHIVYNLIGHCVNLQATTMELKQQNLRDLMQAELETNENE